MSTGRNLPDEIMLEILLRLPTKCLGRFKSISKSWRALISTPEFAKTHLALKNRRHRPELLIRRGPFFDIVKIDDVPSVSSSLIDFKQTHRLTWLYGSCDGLILARAQNHQLFLLNPTTRECKNLPSLVTKGPFFGNIAYGFGYDSISDDYKVVVFVSGVVHVYSLRNDSWKIIQVSPFDNNAAIIDHSRPGIFLNGSIHWFCYLPSLVSIIAFDLVDEKFKNVPQPCDYHLLAHKEPFLSLHEVGGFLCLLHVSQTVDFWVMKDYGVESSWTKFDRVIKMDFGSVHPLFRRRGHVHPVFYLPDKEIVLLHIESDGIKVVIYNVMEKTSRIVRSHEVSIMNYEICMFWDSLVSPRQFNR